LDGEQKPEEKHEHIKLGEERRRKRRKRKPTDTSLSLVGHNFAPQLHLLSSLSHTKAQKWFTFSN